MIPIDTTNLRNQVHGAARQFGLDPDLVGAIIFKESGGLWWVHRYENSFYMRYLMGRTRARLGGHWPAQITAATEKKNRAYSFGLMQIMGQVAREQGYVRDDLWELRDIPTNLYYGCKKLRQEIVRAGSVEGGVIRYNGSIHLPGPKAYAADVLESVTSKRFEVIYT